MWTTSYDPGGYKSRKQQKNEFSELPDPTLLTEERSLLGFYIVLRGFVASFPRIPAPLNRKPQKDRPESFPKLATEDRHSMDH